MATDDDELEGNALEGMEIDEIALCRKGAHAGAKIVLQKSEDRTTPTTDPIVPKDMLVKQRFALAALRAKRRDSHTR